MTIADRTVTTTWDGPLAAGTGSLGDSSSGVLDGQAVTWASRTESPDGTSPEELAAGAHSSCFAMALALQLGENGSPPQQLRVSATVTLTEDGGRPTIVTSALRVRARVDGLGADDFARVVDAAAELCPVSRLFAGATISIDAQLESA